MKQNVNRQETMLSTPQQQTAEPTTNMKQHPDARQTLKTEEEEEEEEDEEDEEEEEEEEKKKKKKTKTIMLQHFGSLVELKCSRHDPGGGVSPSWTSTSDT